MGKNKTTKIGPVEPWPPSPKIRGGLMGSAALERDQARAEKDPRKNCLVCGHFKYRGQGAMVICTERTRTQHAVAAWGGIGPRCGSYTTCSNRAASCRDFDEMRPSEHSAFGG